jgi:hypothetical protein
MSQFFFFTSSKSIFLFNSASLEVTAFPLIPHGIIGSK